MATLTAKLPAKQKAEVKRKAELIAATIVEIGEAGTLDVTVGRIAKRAGISPALAFHYFGDKESLFLAAMQKLLTDYAISVRTGLRGASGVRGRAASIVTASFSKTNFRRGEVAAWLNFYVLAQKSPRARRLLDAYRARVQSNLAHALRPSLASEAPAAAERIAGLVDGLYLHAALDLETSATDALAHIMAAIDHELDAAK